MLSNLRRKKELQSFVIVRTCVGCILPENAKLIGTGEYNITKLGKTNKEPYYDYQIEEILFDQFIEQNKQQLVDYQLFEIEKEIETDEDKNPVKKTTLRGYSRVDYDNEKSAT